MKVKEAEEIVKNLEEYDMPIVIQAVRDLHFALKNGYSMVYTGNSIKEKK